MKQWIGAAFLLYLLGFLVYVVGWERGHEAGLAQVRTVFAATRKAEADSQIKWSGPFWVNGIPIEQYCEENSCRGITNRQSPYP